MDDHTHPMLAKVRKLLAQAESPACTPEEAEAFTAKAAELIAAYGIDEALIAAGGAPGRDPVVDRVIDLHPPYAREKGALGGEVAHALRCQAVLTWRNGRDVLDVRTLHVFGHRSDLRAVDVLLTSLLVQGSREVARTQVPRGHHVAAFRRTWWLGFAAAIGSRLRAAEREAAVAAEGRFAARGTSAALVLADRAAEARAAMLGAYPHVRSSARRRLSGGGLSEGWSAGHRADLGGARVRRGTRGEIAG